MIKDKTAQRLKSFHKIFSGLHPFDCLWVPFMAVAYLGYLYALVCINAAVFGERYCPEDVT